MRRYLYKFLSITFLPFLLGAKAPDPKEFWTPNPKAKEAAGYYLEKVILPPHANENIAYSFTLISTKACSIYVQFGFDYFNFANAPYHTEGQYRKEERFKKMPWKVTKKGERLKIEGIWQMKYSWEKGHEIAAYLKTRTEGIESSPRYKTLNLVYSASSPNVITPSSFPWQRSYEATCNNFYSYHKGYVHGFIFGGENYECTSARFGITGYGFKEKYIDPIYNFIPFDFGFEGFNYWGNPLILKAKEGYLEIDNFIQAFDIGYEFYDKENKKYVRRVPLKLIRDDIKTKIDFLNPIYSSPEGNHSTDKAHHPLNYHRSNGFFLPENYSSSPREYSMRIVFKGFGELSYDSFLHEFKVIKNFNYFGSLNNSKFTLSEVL